MFLVLRNTIKYMKNLFDIIIVQNTKWPHEITNVTIYSFIFGIETWFFHTILIIVYNYQSDKPENIHIAMWFSNAKSC